MPQTHLFTRKISRTKAGGMHENTQFRSIKNYAFDACKSAN